MTDRLPKQDPRGIVPDVAAFVLLMARNLGSTVAMQRTGTAAVRRPVLSLIGYAITTALVLDVIIGPTLGAHPDVGSDFWPVWGGFALMCLTVALWQGIGPGLPPRNGTTLVRNALSFDADSITQPLVVLSTHVVVGAALVISLTCSRLLWGRGAKTRRSPISPTNEGGIAAVPPA